MLRLAEFEEPPGILFVLVSGLLVEYSIEIGTVSIEISGSIRVPPSRAKTSFDT
jgi:hypothetical protein